MQVYEVISFFLVMSGAIPRTARSGATCSTGSSSEHKHLPTFYDDINTDELMEVITGKGWSLKTQKQEHLQFTPVGSANESHVQVVNLSTEQPDISKTVKFQTKLTPQFTKTDVNLSFTLSECDDSPGIKARADVIRKSREPRYGCFLLTEKQITDLHTHGQLGNVIKLQDGGEDWQDQNQDTHGWAFGLDNQEFGCDIKKDWQSLLTTRWYVYDFSQCWQFEKEVDEVQIEPTSETTNVTVKQKTQVNNGTQSTTYVYANNPCGDALWPSIGQQTQVTILRFDVLIPAPKTIKTDMGKNCAVCFEPFAGSDVTVLPCAHMFCSRCTAGTAKESTLICPLCRADTGVDATVETHVPVEASGDTPAEASVEAPAQAPVEAPVEATSKTLKRTRGKQESTAELRRSSRRSY